MALRKGKFPALVLFFLMITAGELAAASRNKLQRPELYRYVYTVTGIKPDESVTYYSLTARPVAFYYSSVHWNTKGFPERKLDYLFPEFSGIFDTAGYYYSSGDDISWVSSVEVREENPYSVEEPEEILTARNELEKMEKAGSTEKNKEDKKDAKTENETEIEKENENENALSEEELLKESLSDEELLLKTEEGISLEDLPDLQSSVHGTSEEDQSLTDGSLLPRTALSSAERRLKNSENQLRLHIFEEEILSLQNIENEKVVILSDGKKMLRKFLDSNLRLYKLETWKIGKNLKDITLVSSEKFEYTDENAVKPKSKVLTSEKNEQKIRYDEKNRVSEILNFGYPEKSDSSSSKTSSKKTETEIAGEKDAEKEKLLLGKTEYKYTEENKILEKKYTEYEYSDEKYGKLIASYEKKDVYDYKNPDYPPDYYYYEGGKLCLKTIYSSSRDYITVIYFENDVRVENYYENGKHVKDYFFVENKLKRKKSYE